MRAETFEFRHFFTDFSAVSTGRLISKLPLMLMFLFRVQDAKDNDAVAFDAIEMGMEKTAPEQSATVVPGGGGNIMPQAASGGIKLFQGPVLATCWRLLAVRG